MLIMKKIIVSIALLGVAFLISALAEDYCFRGAGTVVGVLVFLSAFAVGNKTKLCEKVGSYLFVLGPIVALTTFLLAFLLPIHVKKSDSSIKVMSRYGMRTLAVGTRIDTINLAYAFRSSMGFIAGVETADFHFLYTLHDTCVVCDHFGKQLEVVRPVRIISRQFENSSLYFMEDGAGNVFDLHGTAVDDGYMPIKIEYPIQEPLN